MIGDAFHPESTNQRASRPYPNRDFEQSVLPHLERHGEDEGAILESYRLVVERSSAGEVIQFLVKLILDDEKRHHQVFAQMANEFRSFLWEIPVEPSSPTLETHADPDLLAETKRLLAFEKKDAQEPKRLRQILKSGQPSSLNPLMVELMLLDTAKHIAILEHIKS